ncbi:hypothetical protein QYG89_06460 [Bacillus sp. B190/17]|uniref:HTH HARE-type domain-containing protein n=1 Tax=Bacillus lumedeiriae TaxID=3058829 RepID=A0ABW8I786_9BACI
MMKPMNQKPASKNLLLAIIKAVHDLGGTASLDEIYSHVQKNPSIDLTPYQIPESRIRTLIYDHSSDTHRFKGTPGDHRDIFYPIRQKGDGYWGLRINADEGF